MCGHRNGNPHHKNQPHEETHNVLPKRFMNKMAGMVPKSNEPPPKRDMNMEFLLKPIAAINVDMQYMTALTPVIWPNVTMITA